MSTSKNPFRRWLPTWLLASAQLHHDLLEQRLARHGVTMEVYSIFKGLSETMLVGLCIYSVAQGGSTAIAMLVAGTVVLGWEGVEKLLLLNNVDADVLEELQAETDDNEDD